MQKIFYAFDQGMYNPFKMQNAQIFINPAQKEEKVLFKEDKPWELRFDNSYPNFIYDEELKLYRAYYHTFTQDPCSFNSPLNERKSKSYEPVNRIVSLCYAQSKDGLSWDKPNLGLVDFKGSKDNNILGEFYHGSCVLLDKQEIDPSKRYKLITKIDYGNNNHYFAVSFSKDGLSWSPLLKLQDFNPRGDTHNYAFFHEESKQYILITREWRDSKRVVMLAKSFDFINWSKPIEIMSGRGFSNQIYSMPIFRVNDYLIGLASMFHEGDIDNTNHDQVDLELCYAINTTNWNFLAENEYFIKRGEGSYQNTDKAPDCGCIYSSAPIIKDDELIFYYLGSNGLHTGFREGSFLRAFANKNQLAYISSKDKSKNAVIYTNKFNLLKNEIYIDAIRENEYAFIQVNLISTDNKDLGEIELTQTKSGLKLNLNYLNIEDKSPKSFKITLRWVKIFSIKGSLDLHRIENEAHLFRA